MQLFAVNEWCAFLIMHVGSGVYVRVWYLAYAITQFCSDIK